MASSLQSAGSESTIGCSMARLARSSMVACRQGGDLSCSPAAASTRPGSSRCSSTSSITAYPFRRHREVQPIGRDGWARSQAEYDNRPIVDLLEVGRDEDDVPIFSMPED